MITVSISSWECTQCQYKQDFEPTMDCMSSCFNENKTITLSTCKEFECPACALRGIRGSSLILSKKSKITQNISDVEYVEPEYKETEPNI